MQPPQVISVNIGSPQPIVLPWETVLSGIFKQPVDRPVRFGRTGLTGDATVDLRNHGGRDKAVNVYPSEHFAYWHETTGLQMSAGAFGENLTTVGLDETTIWIGDRWRIGAVLAQVTQPRQPCQKLSARHRRPELVKEVYQSGKTGFYLRCLEPGPVCVGDTWHLEDRVESSVTVLEALRIRDGERDQAAVERLLTVEGLSEAWQAELTRISLNRP